MNNEQILNQLSIAVAGIEEIKQSNVDTKVSLEEFKCDFKAEIANLKLEIGKLDVKADGIDTRLKNEESVSRSVLGVFAGGTILAIAKYLFFQG